MRGSAEDPSLVELWVGDVRPHAREGIAQFIGEVEALRRVKGLGE